MTDEERFGMSFHTAGCTVPSFGTLSSVTRHELQMAYFFAMQDWMNEEASTRLMVMQQNDTGFSEQLKKEVAALERYHEAMAAFVNGPKE